MSLARGLAHPHVEWWLLGLEVDLVLSPFMTPRGRGACNLSSIQLVCEREEMGDSGVLRARTH